MEIILFCQAEFRNKGGGNGSFYTMRECVLGEDKEMLAELWLKPNPENVLNNFPAITN